jgi:hypothetical protein
MVWPDHLNAAQQDPRLAVRASGCGGLGPSEQAIRFPLSSLNLAAGCPGPRRNVEGDHTTDDAPLSGLMRTFDYSSFVRRAAFRSDRLIIGGVNAQVIWARVPRTGPWRCLRFRKAVERQRLEPDEMAPASVVISR